MKIVLLDEAQRRFEAEDRWWRKHRDAKELFFTEFEDVLRQLSSTPGVGQGYRRSHGRLIHRVLMPKVHCHVYYFHDHEREIVEIHSIWGGRRKRGPKL